MHRDILLLFYNKFFRNQRSIIISQPVPVIRGRCWDNAARWSFFSRDNMENFIQFCRRLGVHENLLFESDDLGKTWQLISINCRIELHSINCRGFHIPSLGVAARRSLVLIKSEIPPITSPSPVLAAPAREYANPGRFRGESNCLRIERRNGTSLGALSRGCLALNAVENNRPLQPRELRDREKKWDLEVAWKWFTESRASLITLIVKRSLRGVGVESRCRRWQLDTVREASKAFLCQLLSGFLKLDVPQFLFDETGTGDEHLQRMFAILYCVSS